MALLTAPPRAPECPPRASAGAVGGVSAQVQSADRATWPATIALLGASHATPPTAHSSVPDLAFRNGGACVTFVAVQPGGEGGRSRQQRARARATARAILSATAEFPGGQQGDDAPLRAAWLVPGEALRARKAVGGFAPPPIPVARKQNTQLVDLGSVHALDVLVHGEDYVFVCAGSALTGITATPAACKISGDGYPTLDECGCGVQRGDKTLHLALFAVGLLKALSVDVGGLGALQRFGASASDAELDTAEAEWQAYEDRSSAAVAAAVAVAVASVEARVLRVVVGESGATASAASQRRRRTTRHECPCPTMYVCRRLRLALCETHAVALALRTCGTRTETGWRRPLRVSWRRRGCAQPPRACPRVESDRARRTRLCVCRASRRRRLGRWAPADTSWTFLCLKAWSPNRGAGAQQRPVMCKLDRHRDAYHGTSRVKNLMALCMK